MKASTSMLVFALLVSCGYSQKIKYTSDGEKILRQQEQMSLVSDLFVDNQFQWPPTSSDSSKNGNVLLKTMKWRWDEPSLRTVKKGINLAGDLSNIAMQNAKEGAEFQLELDFLVQRKAVHDLQLGCVVSRKMRNRVIDYDYWYEMMGSYEPQSNAYNFIGAHRKIYKGMLYRGLWVITCRVTDADSYEYLKWQFEMKIAKDWE